MAAITAMTNTTAAQPSATQQTKRRESSDERSPSRSEYECLPAYTVSESGDSVFKSYEFQSGIIGQICTEKGLDMQNFQCKECARPIGLIYGKPRVCSYDAGYYCHECHENDEFYIPSRIIFNWDFRKHKVSKCNRAFLQEVEDHPLLNVDLLNPKLYDHVNEINDIKLLREQLRYLKSYLFSCKHSIAEDFRKMVWPKEYLYDSVGVYSLVDLLQVQSGQLISSLKKILRFASKHVYDCRLCSQKGFICEICDATKVIYPFEIESTFRCHECKAVYHKLCKADKQCPKCHRQKLRHSKLGIKGHEYQAVPLDYACSPEDF